MVLIEMEIWHIELTTDQDQGSITLKEKEVKGPEARILHIFCMPQELSIIAQHFHALPFRPLTTDLIKKIIELCQGKILWVILEDADEFYFRANIIVHAKEQNFVLDCTAIDAIDLAIICRVPIFASAEALKEYGATVKEWLEFVEKVQKKEKQQFLEELPENALAKFKV